MDPTKPKSSPILTLPPIPALPGTIALRRWHATDAPSLARAADNRAIWRNLADRMPSPYTLTDAEWWINECSKEEAWPVILHLDAEGRETEHGRVCSEYAIVLTDQQGGDEILGSVRCIVGTDTGRRTVELGYWLAEAYWGRGIMSTVAGEFVRWIWRTFPAVVKINVKTYERNKGSAGVLRKAGFELEGTVRAGYFKDGKVGDLLYFGCVREGLQWRPKVPLS